MSNNTLNALEYLSTVALATIYLVTLVTIAGFGFL